MSDSPLIHGSCGGKCDGRVDRVDERHVHRLLGAPHVGRERGEQHAERVGDGEHGLGAPEQPPAHVVVGRQREPRQPRSAPRDRRLQPPGQRAQPQRRRARRPRRAARARRRSAARRRRHVQRRGHPDQPGHQQQPDDLQAQAGARGGARARARSAARPAGRPPRSAGRVPEPRACGRGGYLWSPMSLYDHVADLPLKIEGYALERLARTVSSGFERVSTCSRCSGGGAEGRGEDVTYEAEAQDAQQAAGPVLELAGEWTFGSFSEHLGDARSLPRLQARAARLPPLPALGLRVGGARPRAAPGRQVAARRCSAATPSRSRSSCPRAWASRRRSSRSTRRLARYPELRFKLDATPDWSDELIAELQATGAVDSIDFKGAYKGTVVDVQTDPELLPARSPRRSRTPGSRTPTSRPRRRAARSPPTRTGSPGTRRSTSVDDILAAPVMPRTVNLKPSRFGSLRGAVRGLRVLRAARDGRLRRRPVRARRRPRPRPAAGRAVPPDAPNDIAPGGYDALDPEPGLPRQPARGRPGAHRLPPAP